MTPTYKPGDRGEILIGINRGKIGTVIRIDGNVVIVVPDDESAETYPPYQIDIDSARAIGIEATKFASYLFAEGLSTGFKPIIDHKSPPGTKVMAKGYNGEEHEAVIIRQYPPDVAGRPVSVLCWSSHTDHFTLRDTGNIAAAKKAWVWCVRQVRLHYAKQHDLRCLAGGERRAKAQMREQRHTARNQSYRQR